MPRRLRMLIHEAHEAFGIHRGHRLTAWVGGSVLTEQNYHDLLCDGMDVQFTVQFGDVGPE